jgi:2-polyprenyl-3-methyl-5-hydroxy-6-metoxy-1,4-benzoquinol methylase/GT2 family glycosyltransferase
MAQGEALNRCDCVILTDDCSQDKTIEVANATWNGPIPLVVFAAEKNRGEYKNMNECIARLPEHIEWYLVMHADNMAKPGWLQTLLDRADIADECVGTIFTSWDILAENGAVTKGEYRQPPTIVRIPGNDASVLGTIQRGCWWHISSCVSRVRMYREIGGLPLGLRLKGDWDFLLRLLGAGWDVEYIPSALMVYRDNPEGSSSISFRLHRDIYETLNVTRRHHMVASSLQISAYHATNLRTLVLRLLGSVRRGRWERALRTIPTAGFVMKSWGGCLKDRWLARRRFNWVASTDAEAEARLHLLSHLMVGFYSRPETRRAYQAMIDDEANSQPLTEAELRKAILITKPETVLEVGCGSGRIFGRLLNEGMTARYTGVEVSEDVVVVNRKRFPTAAWHAGTSDNLPVQHNSQDCVFAYYVLEHCAFPKHFLENLLDTVKPGGRLLLTFPDIMISGIFGSQALGWDRKTAKEHLRKGHLAHAFIRLWDTRIRLPAALRRVGQKVGTFPVNLNPQCFEPGIKIEPNIDAIYVASRAEVQAWAMARGCQVNFPGGEHRELVCNVLIEITKPADTEVDRMNEGRKFEQHHSALEKLG